MSKLAEHTADISSQKIVEFLNKYGKHYDSMKDKYYRTPFVSNVKVGKSSLIYNAHSYWTKVPHEGIEPFILHYTDPGDIVLDPFCGTGMTGIACSKNGRRSILIDLCPAATFIARNYNSCSNIVDLRRSIEKILSSLDEIKWLYETTCAVCGKRAVTVHSILSELLECPRCSGTFAFWDVAVDSKGKIKKTFFCPNCKKELTKSNCRKVLSTQGTSTFVMSEIHYECSCSQPHRKVKKPDSLDHQLLEKLESTEIPYWFPSYPFPDGYNTRQPKAMGMNSIDKLYTKRNLFALAKLWYSINTLSTDTTIQKMRWIFTSLLQNASRGHAYSVEGGATTLKATYYIPSICKEVNVIELFKRKSLGKRSFISVENLLRSHIKSAYEALVLTQSATDLSNIPSSSIDYVFTDPPFGQNINYSEMNFIWECWLGEFTHNEQEAVINPVQQKSIREYELLMTRAFQEIYRVLKPNRWFTLVFHNSRGDVWQAIQNGLTKSGFIVGMIGVFDKIQKTFKQKTASGAVGYDVVVNCYKPKATVKNGIEGKTTEEAIIGFLADRLRELPLTPIDERTDRMLHSKTIGFFMLQNRPLRKLSFEDFQGILKKNFREIDGYWYLPFQRPKSSGQKRLFGYISNESEALEWLEQLLKTPHTYGDIAPEFFKALGSQKLGKDLQEILQENFVEEKGLWRNPTVNEKERLIKRLTDKTARQIDEYLKDTIEYTPSDTEICEWIEFCYNNGLYLEGAELLHHINEKTIDPELYKKTKKIAEICRIKAWE